MPVGAMRGLERQRRLDLGERRGEESLLRVEDRELVVQARHGNAVAAGLLEQSRGLLQPPALHQRLRLLEDLGIHERHSM